MPLDISCREIIIDQKIEISWSIFSQTINDIIKVGRVRVGINFCAKHGMVLVVMALKCSFML